MRTPIYLTWWTLSLVVWSTLFKEALNGDITWILFGVIVVWSLLGGFVAILGQPK